MTYKKQILLADDHPLILRGIVAELEEENLYDIVATVSNGQDAIEQILKLKPHLAIIDMQMPIKNGIEVLQALKASKAVTKVIILTMFKERYLLKQALELGAKGYLIKDTLTNEIHECIRNVLKNEVFVSKSMDESTDLAFINIPEYSKLTRMEKKVLNLVRQSMTSKAIAEELYLSVKTIENHRYNIGKKLKIKGGKNDILKYLLKKMN